MRTEEADRASRKYSYHMHLFILTHSALQYYLTSYSGSYATEGLDLRPLAISFLIFGATTACYMRTLMMAHFGQIYLAAQALVRRASLLLCRI